MSSYRVRPRSAAWKDSKRVCLAVSVGSPAHEGDKLASAIRWINANFQNVIVDVSDTLQRWNILNQNGMTMHEATQIARQLGIEWVNRNASQLSSLPSGTEVIHWDRWLNHSEYFHTLSQVRKLYESNQDFYYAVNFDAETYLDRRSDLSGLVMADQILQNSRSFIIEECAAHSILGRAYPCTKIYPAHSLKSLALLRSGCLPNAPKGLEQETYVKIDFEKIGELAAETRLYSNPKLKIA